MAVLSSTSSSSGGLSARRPHWLGKGRQGAPGQARPRRTHKSMGNGQPEGHRPNPPAPQGDVEGVGRTVEEAIERVLASIGLDRKDVDVEVIDEGGRGVLGVGAREARVRVRPRSGANRAGVIRAVAEELIGLMGFEAAITTAEGPESVRVEVEGENLGALIGKHGQPLAAMEALADLLSGGRPGGAG